MNDKSDPNWEFSNDVIASMVQLLSNPNLGEETLEHSAQWTAEHTITIIRCMAETSDMWFYSKSQPRTVLYAIYLNTVHEYILDNVDKYNKREFWADIQFKILEVWHKIGEICDNIKPNDKIDIDEYHEEFRKELDVITQ